MSHLITGLIVAVTAIAIPAVAAPNLVTNGDFEAGNAGFWSDYAYSPDGNVTEAQYTVRADPYPWNGAFVSAADHTTGEGNMFVGNGSPKDGEIVWKSGPILVSEDTGYFFEAWVMNVCCNTEYTGSNSPSILEFTINGVPVGTRTTDLGKAGTWEGFSSSWSSGATTTAVLSIINLSTAAGGNDFAVDDIRLSTQSSVTPAIPEPATCALLVAGLALTGAVARRRRSAGPSV